MKQTLLRTSFGISLLNLREAISLAIAAIVKPEAVGMLANDVLSTKLITKICSSNKTFIDIGAHIGSIISAVSSNDSSISVVAVEAIPEKAANLKRVFPNAEIHQCALGDGVGKISFYVYEKQSGYSSLLKPSEENADKASEITVELKMLDDLCKQSDIDAIKIDVEGAELGVLLGGVNTIKNNNPIIMFESAPDENELTDKKKIWDLFASLDYGIHLPNRVAHNDSPLTKEGFLDSHTYPRYTTNYFAIPFHRRQEYRDRARRLLKIKPKI